MEEGGEVMGETDELPQVTATGSCSDSDLSISGI